MCHYKPTTNKVKEIFRLTQLLIFIILTNYTL